MEENMRVKLSILITILSFIWTVSLFAHPYDFIKELKTNCQQGINEDLISNFPLYGLETTIMNYNACAKPQIMQNLSPAQKAILEKLALKIEKVKSSLSPAQLANIKKSDDYVVDSLRALKDAVEPQDLSKLTKEETAELDKNLKAIFWKMINALKINDIELALTYFSDYHKDKQRKIFKALSAEALQESIKNIKELSLTWARGDTVHYEVSNTQNGQNYFFPLSFFQDLDGKWRILDF